jgi:hypothetical protein
MSSLIGMQNMLAQQMQGGGSNNKQLEQDRRWEKLKSLVSSGIEGAQKGAAGEFGTVDPTTGKKEYANKMEEIADKFKTQRPNPSSAQQLGAQETADIANEEPAGGTMFSPSAVQAPKMGQFGSIGSQDMDYMSKMEILKKMIGG